MDLCGCALCRSGYPSAESALFNVWCFTAPFENNVFCVCSVLSHPSHASALGLCAVGVCASRGPQLRLRITRLPSEAFSGSPR